MKIMRDFFISIFKKNFDKRKMQETFDLIKILDAGRLSLLKKEKIKINYN